MVESTTKRIISSNILPKLMKLEDKVSKMSDTSITLLKKVTPSRPNCVVLYEDHSIKQVDLQSHINIYREICTSSTYDEKMGLFCIYNMCKSSKCSESA